MQPVSQLNALIETLELLLAQARAYEYDCRAYSN